MSGVKGISRDQRIIVRSNRAIKVVTGLAGPKGDQGIQGDPGLDGADGLTTVAISDTEANLISSNPVVPDGEIAFANDTIKFAVGDGSTPWNGLPKMMSGQRTLDRSESTVLQSGISAVTDLTGLSVSFVVVSDPVEVKVFCPYVFSNTALSVLAVGIYDAANVLKRQSYWTCDVANTSGHLTVYEYITTPGFYTRKARIRRHSAIGTVGNNLGVADTVATIEAYTKPNL